MRKEKRENRGYGGKERRGKGKRREVEAGKG